MVHVGLVVAGGAAALLALRVAWKVHESRQRARWRDEQMGAWTEIARSLGYRAEAREGEATIVGEAASRPFVIDGGNFLGYGADVENCLHVRIEDEEARFHVRAGEPSDRDVFHGDLRKTGDAEFDARATVRANERGLALLARLGPDERRVLLERPGLEVLLGGGRGTIRLPYRLTAGDVAAAASLSAALWPAADARPRA